MFGSVIAIAAIVAYWIFCSAKEATFRQQKRGFVGTCMEGHKDILVLQNAFRKTSVRGVEIGIQLSSASVMAASMLRYINRVLQIYRWHCQAGSRFKRYIEQREK